MRWWSWVEGWRAGALASRRTFRRSEGVATSPFFDFCSHSEDTWTTERKSEKEQLGKEERGWVEGLCGHATGGARLEGEEC